MTVLESELYAGAKNENLVGRLYDWVTFANNRSHKLVFFARRNLEHKSQSLCQTGRGFRISDLTLQLLGDHLHKDDYQGEQHQRFDKRQS